MPEAEANVVDVQRIGDRFRIVLLSERRKTGEAYEQVEWAELRDVKEFWYAIKDIVTAGMQIPLGHNPQLRSPQVIARLWSRDDPATRPVVLNAAQGGTDRARWLFPKFLFPSYVLHWYGVVRRYRNSTRIDYLRPPCDEIADVGQ
jgi:hypothetical protein